MAHIGNRPTPSTSFTTLLKRSNNGGEQWGQLFGAPGQFFWAIRVGANLQRNPSASPQRAALALWDGGGGLLGQTGYLTMPTTMGAVAADMASAVLVRADQSWIAGPVIEQVGGIAVDVSNARLIQREGSASAQRAFLRMDRLAPANPFGSYSGDVQDGQNEGSRGFAVWLEGQPNNPPNAPYDLSLNGVAITTSGSLATIDTTPTFAARFYDYDETLSDNGRLVAGYGAADKMSAYQVYVTNAAGAMSWDSGTVTATGADQTARLFGITSATLAGGAYTVHMRARDLAGAWGPEAIAFFTVASATTEAVGTPSGKITDTTPDTFGWRFNNTGGGTADRVQLRLLQNGGIIASSPEIAGTFNPNVDFYSTWAQTGFLTLVPGGQYSYQVRHRYAGGTVWTDWSPQRSFNVNSPPNIPTILTTSGASFATHPTLQFRLSDVDDPANELTGYVEITRPDATIVGLGVGSGSNDGAGTWSQVTNASINTQYGSYTYRILAGDPAGLLSPWSGYATYNYGAYPYALITSVSPLVAGKVPSSTPTISWTTEGTTTPTAAQQASWQIIVYPSGSAEPTLSSPVTSSQATSWQVPASRLRQGAYDVTLTIANSVGLQGTTARTTFTIEFIPPPALTNVSAQPLSLPNDYSNAPTGAIVQWDASSASPNVFQRYEVYRSDLTQPLIAISNQAQTRFVDPQPPGNVEVTYSVVQVTKEGLDEIVSNRVAVTTMVPIRDLVLTDAISGTDDRLVLRYVDSLREQLVKDEVEIITWETAPTAMEGGAEFVRIPITARIRPNDDPAVDARRQLDAYRALIRKRVLPDGKRRPRVICLRDATGRRRFGRLGGGADIEDTTRLLLNGVSFTFSEVDFAEGVTTGETA